ncbi:MAG: hypothetical protein U9P71_02620 [Campylobacterota bacterium]|nr:hypothetical protein [Campylobacterota bacterium]
MFSTKALERIKIIEKKINFIETIVKEKGSVIAALEDEQNSRASILMHLISIAELRELRGQVININNNHKITI